jgi:hypothetical protein
MAIDAVVPISRENPAASAVSQLSLTRRARELQLEEGQPPMEVASAEQEALQWQKDEGLRERGKRRQSQQSTMQSALQEEHEEAGAQHPETLQPCTEVQEEEETGTLFDDRS